MNVLLIGTDRTALDPRSPLSVRLRAYERAADNMDVVVPTSHNRVSALLELRNRAMAVLRAGHTDVISTRDTYFLGFVVARLARRFNLALEVQVHGFEKMSCVRRFVARRVLRMADSVRVVSERLKAVLIDEWGVPEEAITVAPIYTDWERFQLAEPTFDLRARCPRRFVFVTVGRLAPVKNIAMQIEAFRIFREKHRDSVLLVVGDGREKKNLTELAVRHKLGDAVFFEGRTADVAPYYKGADCLLLTSNSEGWGLVAIEAASVGLPIIMTDVGLAGEVITQTPRTRIIPVGDVRALAREMEYMFEHRPRETTFGFEDVHSRLLSEEQTLDRMRISWNKAINRHGRH